MVAGRGWARGSPVDVEGVRGAFFVFYRCILLAFLMVLLRIGPETYRLLALFWGLTFGVVEVGWFQDEVRGLWSRDDLSS